MSELLKNISDKIDQMVDRAIAHARETGLDEPNPVALRRDYERGLTRHMLASLPMMAGAIAPYSAVTAPESRATDAAPDAPPMMATATNTGLYYVIVCRDSTDDYKPITGLSPTWSFLKRLADGADLPGPPISEIRGGQYRIGPVDVEAMGDCSGQVNMGQSVKSAYDRILDVEFYVSEYRAKVNLDAPVSGAGGGGGVAKVVTVGAIQMGVIKSACFEKGTMATLLSGANLKLISQ